MYEREREGERVIRRRGRMRVGEVIEKRRVEWRERGRGERNRERKKTGGEEIRERDRG